MFRPEDKTVIPEPTPERVYQCALYLQKQEKGIKRDAYVKAMTMADIYGENKKIFDDTYSVIKDLELATEKDGLIYPSENLMEIKNADDFRRYAARTIFRWEDSLFSRVTSMYCQYAEYMMKNEKWEDITTFMGQHGLQFHFNVIKGWRLWAPFLGCGYLTDAFMIPNWQKRIADLLYDQTEFPTNTEIPIAEFMNWLQEKAPEIKYSINGIQIGLGVSNGLRTLDAMNILKVIFTPDSNPWRLVETSGIASISHVKIVR